MNTEYTNQPQHYMIQYDHSDWSAVESHTQEPAKHCVLKLLKMTMLTLLYRNKKHRWCRITTMTKMCTQCINS